MIGICIPAHNEAEHIAACLASVAAAACHPGLHGEPVTVLLVLDSCVDGTAAIAANWPVELLTVAVRNVGIARGQGAQHLMDRGARWLAFTDADTQVSPRWLVDQLALGADVVCGTVAVCDWSPHGSRAPLVRSHFESSYDDRDGHRHVHGANLGMSADHYQRAGGFDALHCGEDQALVDRLAQLGADIAWTARPRVSTSARPISRVRGGFADALCAPWTCDLSVQPLASCPAQAFHTDPPHRPDALQRHSVSPTPGD